MVMNKYALKNCIRQTAQSLSRNSWFAVITTGLIAISLAILGAFLLLTTNVNQFIRDVESNVEVSVFLNEDANVADVQKKLDNLVNVVEHTFVSKEQGLEEFAETMGDPTLLRDLRGENNPLPDLIRVHITSPEQVAAAAEEIQLYPEVELVDYGGELVTHLIQTTNSLNLIFLVAGIFIALGAVFLIINIVRLSVVARQDEVSVMKYLGASNGYIRFPFIMEGMVMGWIGTLMAVGLLIVIYTQLVSSLGQDAFLLFFQPVTDMSKLVPIFAGLMIAGTLMSGFASLISIRKNLRV